MLLDNKNAAPNPAALNRLTFLAGELGAIDLYASEKAHKIVDIATKFYSQRKHSNHPGGSIRLYGEMRNDLLARIKSQAAIRSEKGD